MSKDDIEKLNKGDQVLFSGILSPEGDIRQGKFVRVVNEYLTEVDYGDHTEHNHIANIFLPPRSNDENN